MTRKSFKGAENNPQLTALMCTSIKLYGANNFSIQFYLKLL